MNLAQLLPSAAHPVPRGAANEARRHISNDMAIAGPPASQLAAATPPHTEQGDINLIDAFAVKGRARERLSERL